VLDTYSTVGLFVDFFKGLLICLCGQTQIALLAPECSRTRQEECARIRLELPENGARRGSMSQVIIIIKIERREGGRELKENLLTVFCLLRTYTRPLDNECVERERAGERVCPPGERTHSKHCIGLRS